MGDLSRNHHLLGDLFTSSSDAPSGFDMTEAQIQQFHEQGYLAGVRLLNERQLKQLRSELDTFFVPDHAGSDLWHEYHANESTEPNQILFHALGAWRLREGFHDLLWNQAFTRPARQLLGGPVRFWHDQLFCKPSKQGGVVAWHQDYSYWTRTQPMQHLTCWLGLDDATTENGCLQYIPGSHLWDLLPITGLAGDMDAIREVLSEDQWEQLQSPVSIELKAGECAFHHPLMVHGSTENRSAKPRRATVLNVVRDGVRSYSNEPLLKGVPPIPEGDLLDGQFFPLLCE